MAVLTQEHWCLARVLLAVRHVPVRTREHVVLPAGQHQPQAPDHTQQLDEEVLKRVA